MGSLPDARMQEVQKRSVKGRQINDQKDPFFLDSHAF
jgi:hypothetical protein